MPSFPLQAALSIVRHFLTIGFTALAARGLITDDQADAAAGALIVLATIGFGVYDKWKHHAGVEVAQPNPPQPVTPSPPATTSAD